MKASFAKITLFLIAILYLASCGNSLDDMLDNYNKNFSGGGSEVSKSEIEPVIDEKELLLDSYVVSQIATLNLAAPYSFSDYKWVVQDPEGGTLDPVSVNTSFGTTDTSRRFTLYLPTSRLSAGKTYRLCLAVTDEMGTEYTDYASLAVYNDYFFGTGIVTIPPAVSSISSRSAFSSDSNSAVLCKSPNFSILPDSSIYNVSDYNFKLYAKNLLNGTKNIFRTLNVGSELSVDSAESKIGTLSLNLPKSCWFVTVLAIPEAVEIREPADGESDDDYLNYLTDNASFIGESTFDNRNTSKMDIQMISTGSGERSLTGKGSAELYLYANGWIPSTEDFSAKIEKVETDGTTLIGEEKSLTLGSEKPAEANFILTDIPAGTYDFVFLAKHNDIIFEWRDSILIVSGKPTTAVIGVPDFINRSGT